MIVWSGSCFPGYLFVSNDRSQSGIVLSIPRWAFKTILPDYRYLHLYSLEILVVQFWMMLGMSSVLLLSKLDALKMAPLDWVHSRGSELRD